MTDFNIAEALKYAPKGLKLYSPVLGEVELSEVSQGTYAIEVKISDKHYSFTEHGCYLEGKGECLLFPSKDHRTWDNWQDILLPQCIGCVCVNTGTPEPTMFICTSNGTVFADNSGTIWEALIGQSGNYLKSSRYASLEEIKQFFDNLKSKGYEWDGESVVKTTPTSPFKVGDWVVKKDGSHFSDGSSCAKITDITSGGQHWFNTDTWLFEEDIRLWTIQDAKCGDVLVSPATQEGDKECPFIFKEIDKNGIVRFYAALLQSEELKIADGITNVMGYANAGYHIPATKEQRDLLFQKIKEACYEWDTTNNSLKRLEDEPFKKVQSDKFDVSSLKPFDKVLMRDSEDSFWGVGLFAAYIQGYEYPFRCNTTKWKQCVPYNDDTKHLVGTTDVAPEFYKTW